MSSEMYEHMRSNPKFQELVSKRSRFAWTLAFIVLTMFYGFVLVVAFKPALLGQPIHQKRQKRLSGLDSTAVLFSGCHHWRRGCRLPLVIFKARRDDDGFLGVGAMNGFAVVAQRGLCKPFRHSHHFCTFRPCVAIAMQCHANHTGTMAAAAETAGAVAF